VRATSELGDLRAARRHLEICVRSGLATADPATDESLRGLRHSRGFDALLATYRRFQRPATDFEPIRTLSDAGLIAEDIAFDARADSWLISSVRERKIVRIGAQDGDADAWRSVGADVWGVFALALDSERQRVWATTSAGAESPPFSEAERGRSAVLELDARSFEVLARYELGDARPHGFGDVALGPGGQLVVSDGIDGGVYVTEALPQPHLRSLVAPGAFRSPQTPALIPGTGRLLVPDYSRGIAIVDPAGGAPRWLAHPPELALYGIDGMYLKGRTLVAIQNGTDPERVLVLRLDASCSAVETWRVAVARAEGLGDPTHGVFVGEDFQFLANSGWDRVGDDGTLRSSATDRPPSIWRLKLRPGERTAACRIR